MVVRCVEKEVVFVGWIEGFELEGGKLVGGDRLVFGKGLREFG